MSATPGKAFIVLHATHLVRNSLNKKNELSKHLSEPLGQILTEEDTMLLRNFLESKALVNILTQISFLSRITQNSLKFSSNKFYTNLRPLVSKLRPCRSDDRNCLAALNETWSEIVNLLTRATEERYPDAQELYGILSNNFLRELIVAANDTGNRCYTTYVDQTSASMPVYVERDPVYSGGGDKRNDHRENLSHPFSMSSPQDDEPSTHHSASMSKSPRKPTINHFPYHSLRRQIGGAGLRHPALPPYMENSLPEPGMLRTVCINRNLPGEPLGITLVTYGSSQMSTGSGSLLSLLRRQTRREANKEPQKVVIQRIIVGSLADKEGKLFPGDEIVELNGVTASSLEAVQKAMDSAAQKNFLRMLVKTPGIGQLKAYIRSRKHPEHKVYVRCLFKYDPLEDTLLPNANLGIAFRSGDVLELVDSQDLNWWQVRRLGSPSLPVGLVPSQTLQERRQAFNQQACRLSASKKTKKVKSIFRAADSSNLLVRSDLWVYEEVVPWPPSPVPTLLLIGPNGVGRRTIKFLLCTQFPQRFSFPVSDTTDPTATPALFRIRTKENMESDIRQGAYVEWGTVDGHHYGISFAAIREIIAAGRTALIDCQCQSVYLLHQPEFNPHVVFVSAPKFEAAKAMMDIGIRKNLTVNKRTSEEIRMIVEESKIFANQNQHLYAHTLVNSNMTESVEKLSQLVSKLERQPGWIPASWACEMSLPKSHGKDRKCEGRLPRLGVSLGPGIPSLPEDNRSVLSRVTGSILSVASPESAVRLARPPSVCSSLQLPGTASKGGRSGDSEGRWRYEKPSSETGCCNPALSAFLPNEGYLVSKAVVQSQLATRSALRDSESQKSSKSTKKQIFTPSVANSNLLLKSIGEDAKANGGDNDGEAISSTSSEDEGLVEKT
ncbi:hypothetical protein TcWFU_002885 [Taenia crassiceps]|uniref:Uncharacterized protein n=1 Tax=Taenia crassiceps TaxID=6207 RepID=A0ABR4QLQ3_9CEST